MNQIYNVSQAKMATHEAVLLKKVKLVDTNLVKLQNMVLKVATNEEGWDMNELIEELEEMSETYQKLLLQFQN